MHFQTGTVKHLRNRSNAFGINLKMRHYNCKTGMFVTVFPLIEAPELLFNLLKFWKVEQSAYAFSTYPHKFSLRGGFLFEKGF